LFFDLQTASAEYPLDKKNNPLDIWFIDPVRINFPQSGVTIYVSTAFLSILHALPIIVLRKGFMDEIDILAGF
jgi:hypothetical protein